MPLQVIMIASAILQGATVFFAVTYARAVRIAKPWYIVAVAFLLMIIRRIIPILCAENDQPSFSYELIGFCISLLLFIGVRRLGSIVKILEENERAIQASEQRFKSYFQLPIIGVSICDRDGNIIDVNAKYCDIVKTNRESLIGKKAVVFIYRDDRPNEDMLLRSILLNQSDFYVNEKRFLLNTNELIWVSQAVRCIRNELGYPDYFIIVTEDISRRKELESSLKGTIHEKELLIRELYHRTKNNLQIISSLLEMESRQVNNAKITSVFSNIEAKIQSMALVQEKLYDYENLSCIVFSEYIIELIDTMKNIFKEKNIAVITDLENVVISIDFAIPCGLIISELMTNSYLHAFEDRDEGTIWITLAHENDDLVELTISDDGIGVDRLDNMNKKFGLMTVYGLVEQIKGQIKVENNNGLSYRIEAKMCKGAPLETR